LQLPLSLASVVMGHLLICVPFSLTVLIARFEGFDRNLEEASADLGEDGWMTFWRVTLPLMLPGIVASLLLTFITSFDEFLVAYFLSGTEATLPVYIWSQLRFPAKLPMVLALGTIILAVSVVLVVLAEKLRNLGVRKPAVGA
jgi:spermidine/putrescine transport system permease protein